MPSGGATAKPAGDPRTWTWYSVETPDIGPLNDGTYTILVHGHDFVAGEPGLYFFHEGTLVHIGA